MIYRLSDYLFKSTYIYPFYIKVSYATNHGVVGPFKQHL